MRPGCCFWPTPGASACLVPRRPALWRDLWTARLWLWRRRKRDNGLQPAPGLFRDRTKAGLANRIRPSILVNAGPCADWRPVDECIQYPYDRPAFGKFDDQPDRTRHHAADTGSPARDTGQHRRAYA